MSGSGLTPGDPLSGGEPERPNSGGLWSDDGGGRPAGYASPPPPGAGGARPAGLAGGGQLVLAGWWRRAGAALIDGLIVGAVALAVMAPLGIGFFSADSDGGALAAILGFALAALVLTVVGFLYAPWLMARTNGQTVGRMATGIRVVRTSGERMSFGWAMLREVAVKGLLINTVAASATFGLATLLDYLWPLWDEENRALHDFLVQTRTVRA